MLAVNTDMGQFNPTTAPLCALQFWNSKTVIKSIAGSSAGIATTAGWEHEQDR